MKKWVENLQNKLKPSDNAELLKQVFEEMGGKPSKQAKTPNNAELLKQVFEAIECGFAEKVGFKVIKSSIYCGEGTVFIGPVEFGLVSHFVVLKMMDRFQKNLL